MEKEEIKRRMKALDKETLKREVLVQKTSLQMYKKFKGNVMSEEHKYNSLPSVILHNGKTKNLPKMKRK